MGQSEPSYNGGGVQNEHAQFLDYVQGWRHLDPLLKRLLTQEMKTALVLRPAQTTRRFAFLRRGTT